MSFQLKFTVSDFNETFDKLGRICGFRMQKECVREYIYEPENFHEKSKIMVRIRHLITSKINKYWIAIETLTDKEINRKIIKSDSLENAKKILELSHCRFLFHFDRIRYCFPYKNSMVYLEEIVALPFFLKLRTVEKEDIIDFMNDMNLSKQQISKQSTIQLMKEVNKLIDSWLIS